MGLFGPSRREKKQLEEWERKYREGREYYRRKDFEGYVKARRCLEEVEGPNEIMAAEQGDITAQYNLAGMYYFGDGVEQNYVEAAKWYRKAAEQGEEEAQYNLALMYYNGRGVKQNYFESRAWFEKAAEQGHASAQFNLGVMYFHGRGALEDRDEALKWYQRAADQGFANAQYNLGQMYYRGWAVKKMMRRR